MSNTGLKFEDHMTPIKKDYSQAACLAEIIQSYVEYENIYDCIKAGFEPSKEQMEQMKRNDWRQSVIQAAGYGHLDLVRLFIDKVLLDQEINIRKRVVSAWNGLFKHLNFSITATEYIKQRGQSHVSDTGLEMLEQVFDTCPDTDAYDDQFTRYNLCFDYLVQQKIDIKTVIEYFNMFTI